ncbi:retrovirus-related pol polyprotein from transposon TNT 1-94 [Tanacetum coccineum]
MIDELSIIETDKVNHTVEMDMLKLVVEVECFGKCVDEFDKVTVLFGEMQLKQEDRSYVLGDSELGAVVLVINVTFWIRGVPQLQGHEKNVSGIVLPVRSDYLYTGVKMRWLEFAIFDLDTLISYGNLVTGSGDIACARRFGVNCRGERWWNRVLKAIANGKLVVLLLSGGQMPLEQFQVNTKFLNTLPDEWSKFVTDVKLVKDLHTTNVDQLHAHLNNKKLWSNCPVFQKGNDPIDAINHMMSFLTAVVTSRYPTTNNQQRNSSNPMQQATINNGRVTLQPIQGRQTSFFVGTSRTYTPGASGSNSGKQRTVICYNCKGEGHMSRQCTKPKRKRDDSWFKEKVLLVQAQAHGQIINEEELAFWQIQKTHLTQKMN